MVIYMNIDIQPGSHIILAGRRWEVVEVELETKHLYVRPSPAGAPPTFESSEFGDVHPRVHQTMRDVLRGSDMPMYLNPIGKDLLQSARNAYSRAIPLDSNIVDTRKDVFLFTWAGTRINRTLVHLLTENAGFSCSDEGICIGVRKASTKSVLSAVKNLGKSNLTEEQLCETVPALKTGKYVPLLGEDLRRLNALHKHYDLEGTLSYLRMHFHPEA